MGNRIVLSGLSGPVQGLHWDTAEGLRIGRTANADVVLDHRSVSREHAEIFWSGNAWMVRDVGSSNGTFVNAVRLDQSPRRLKIEDVVQCGELALRVTALETAARPAPTAHGPVDIKTTGEIVRVQALAQRSWEQALEDLCQTNLEQGNHFLTLIRAGHHLSRIDSLARLLQTLLDDIVAVLDAQWGAVALVDESSRELVLRTVSGAASRTQPDRCYSKTLAQRCFNKGESLLCADVSGLDDLSASESVCRGSMASVICAVLRSPRRRLGVLYLDRGPSQRPFTQSDFLLVDAIAANISVGIESAWGLEKQREQFLKEITSLAQTLLSGKHADLGRHSQKVSRYSLALAEELKLSEQDKQFAQAAGLFHDLGKIAIADAVLNKPGRLTPAEDAEIRSHPVKGADIARTISCLEPILPAIRHHHERWDGTGYPDGLAADRIPLAARIVAVANALEHLSNGKKPSSPQAWNDAIHSITHEAGRQFDPECVAALTRAQAKIAAFSDQLSAVSFIADR